MIEKGVVVELRNGEFGVVSDVLPNFMVDLYTEVYKKPYKYRVIINDDAKVLVTSLDIVHIYVRLGTGVSICDQYSESKSEYEVGNMSARNKELNCMIVKLVNNLKTLLDNNTIPLQKKQKVTEAIVNMLQTANTY